MSSKKSLGEHERRHEKRAPYLCCDKPFFSLANYKRHCCSQHGEKKEFCCPKCGLSFAIKADLNRHMRWESGIRNHICDICGSAYQGTAGLMDHMWVHYQEKEKRHRCTICQKTFRYSSNLSRHRRSHALHSQK